jgi:mannose-6-phosphate isomerase-like protein (cupin superfamily)
MLAGPLAMLSTLGYSLAMPNLAANFVHLGLGAAASVEPPFSGLEWYSDYAARHSADGNEGRLVSWHTFSESWSSWEMHPAGAEVVICVSGRLTLVQELSDGRIERAAVGPGDYVINPPGVWHTADVDGECTALFITAGAGTEHRPR